MRGPYRIDHRIIYHTHVSVSYYKSNKPNTTYKRTNYTKLYVPQFCKILNIVLNPINENRLGWLLC